MDIDAARDLMWLPGRTMKCFPFSCSARSFIAFQKSSRVIWIAIKWHAKLSIIKRKPAHLHPMSGLVFHDSTVPVNLLSLSLYSSAYIPNLHA